jgi:hypothetical protein
MKARASSIVGWICTILLALMHGMATVVKFLPVEPGSAAEQMGQRLGTAGLEHGLGVLEGIVLVLFLIPRTSTLGFVLMTGYMAGILATNLTHGISFAETAPVYVGFVLLALSGWFRNPELTLRLLGKPVPQA